MVPIAELDGGPLAADSLAGLNTAREIADRQAAEGASGAGDAA